MQKFTLVLLCLSLALGLYACAANTQERTGQAQGYGGPLQVRVTTKNGALTNVEVIQHTETQGIGTRAIDAMPAAMVSAGTWDVDIVAGATVTSNALKEAVRTAME